jgi:hypothetical protein
MTLGATSAIYLALFLLLRFFPIGPADTTSRPMIRTARLFILGIVCLLGIGLYVATIYLGFRNASFRNVLFSLVPILGQVFWTRVFWLSGPFLSKFAIVSLTWLAFLLLAIVTGAFKERVFLARHFWPQRSPMAPGVAKSDPLVIQLLRRFILGVVYVLGIGLYVVTVQLGVQAGALANFLYSLVPIMGQIFWAEVFWSRAPFLNEHALYVIALLVWLTFLLLALVTGAFKERDYFWSQVSPSRPKERSGPLLRMVRLSIVIVLYLLGIGIYVLTIIPAFLSGTFVDFVTSLVPILGQAGRLELSGVSGYFSWEYAIGCLIWLALLVLAFITGAFREELSSPNSTEAIARD